MGNEASWGLDLDYSTSLILAPDYTIYGVTVGREQRSYNSKYIQRSGRSGEATYPLIIVPIVSNSLIELFY